MRLLSTAVSDAVHMTLDMLGQGSRGGRLGESSAQIRFRTTPDHSDSTASNKVRQYSDEVASRTEETSNKPDGRVETVPKRKAQLC